MLAGLNEDLALPLLLPRPKISKRGPFYDSVRGRRVLITGAGGSIGSELVVQVAASRPSHITLADISELNLYEIDLTLNEGAPDLSRSAAILDVRAANAVRSLFHREMPDIVFHAAALKHVPLLETPHNLVEAVLTNFAGTKHIADHCASIGAEMVLVSTDKAVYPTSTMGQTKRLAELYMQAVARSRPNNGFSQVRFGNVIGSSGSVVPLFRRQIAQGGPVTVTHPEMTRYMMSIKQAVGLVLAASELQHRNPQHYGLYILDMGDPVRIIDLAEQLIRLAGRQPHTDVEIEIVGMRPGEKLHEELVYPWENLQPTEVQGVRVAQPQPGGGLDVEDFYEVYHNATRRSPEAVRKAMEHVLGGALSSLGAQECN